MCLEEYLSNVPAYGAGTRRSSRPQRSHRGATHTVGADVDSRLTLLGLHAVLSKTDTRVTLTNLAAAHYTDISTQQIIGKHKTTARLAC